MKFIVETLEPRRLFSTLVVGAGQAFSTLQSAADAVAPGDTVVVESGTYAGFELIDRVSGSAASPIVFNFQSGAQITSADGSTSDGIDIEGCGFVTVEGATITNSDGSITRAGIRLADCDNASILNNNISSVGAWGIYTSHSSNTLIQGNTSDNNAAHGMYIANSETNVQVLDNNLFDNANCGIQINGDASQGGSGLMTDLTIAGNVIYDNGSTGGSAINCDGVQDSVIANNLLYNNLHTGIALFDDDSSAGPAGDVVANNTIVMPGLNAVEVESPAAQNFIFKNALIGALSIAPGTSFFSNISDPTIPANLFAPGGFQLADGATGIGVGFGTDSDPATQLVFLQQPSTSTAGTPAPSAFIVEFEDQSGNLVINNRSRVTLSFTGGPAGPGSHIVATVTDTAGVAAFNNVEINAAGNITIEASDGSLAPASSTPIAVSPGAPAKLVYSQPPTSAFAGSPINPAILVTLEDRFNNIATNAVANVTLSLISAPRGASISGTNTATVTTGQATFDNLVLDTAGKYRLTASEDSLTLAPKTITILPAAPAIATFVASPINVEAGHQFPARIRLHVTDAFGNPVASGTPVTLSISIGPAGSEIFGKATVITHNGVAIFTNITFQTAGDYTLTATVDSISVQSAPFTVSPAAASQMIFTEPPTDTTQSTPFDVQIELLDRYGNIATNNSSAITATLRTHPAHSLLTGTNKATATNGIAVFSGLTLNIAGAYTLQFTDGRLHLISSIFNIV